VEWVGGVEGKNCGGKWDDDDDIESMSIYCMSWKKIYERFASHRNMIGDFSKNTSLVLVSSGLYEVVHGHLFRPIEHFWADLVPVRDICRSRVLASSHSSQVTRVL
jgi:hypothetical protein